MLEAGVSKNGSIFAITITTVIPTVGKNDTFLLPNGIWKTNRRCEHDVFLTCQLADQAPTIYQIRCLQSHVLCSLHANNRH